MFEFVSVPSKIIGLLESNVSSREIACGVCLGIFLGFIPLNGPMALLLVLFFFVFKVNRVSTLLTLPLFKAAYMAGLSGVIEKFGGYLLIDAKLLTGFWSALTGLPVAAYLDINNTLVAGGLAASAILSVPVYFIAERLSGSMQKAYKEKVKKSGVAKAVSGIKLATQFDTLVKTDEGVSLNVKGVRQMLFGRLRARLNAGRKPASGIGKRVNIKGVIAVIAALLIIHYGVGLIVSPYAGSLIIDAVNRASGAKISAEKVNIWPLTLSFSVKDLKVFDPNDGDKRIARAADASFRVSPMALLSRRMAFSSISMDGVEVNLEGRPDGSYNVQELVKKRGSGESPKPDILSIMKSAGDNKEPAGKLWDFLKDKFSKGAKDRKRQAESDRASAKTVTELPKGRMVHFKSGPGDRLFEIRRLSIDNGYIKVIPHDAPGVEIDKAGVSLGRLGFDPDNGMSLGLFAINGDVVKGGNKAGTLDILFSQDEDDARLNLNLKDIDMTAVDFVYKDSLPVGVEKGIITLISRSRIRDGEIDSRTSLLLTSHRLVSKNRFGMVFGVMPMDLMVEALNKIDPVELKFSIGGTIESPQYSGFKDSLFALVGPYTKNLQNKLLGGNVQDTVESLKSFLKKTTESIQK